jgi:acyl-CoA dehydrogenase
MVPITKYSARRFGSSSKRRLSRSSRHGRERGAPPQEFYRRAGDLGIPGLQIPEENGGGDQQSFLFNAIVTEEAFRARVGLGSLRVHMDIVLPYLMHYATDQQKERWLPGAARGELMTPIAMTEP